MSNQILIELELEAHQARSEANQCKQALAIANTTSATALRRVEQLQKQRRKLASHILALKRSKFFDQRELKACATEIERLTNLVSDHQTAILRIGEERDHLRMELVGEKAAALVTVTSIKQDLDSCRETSHRLAYLLRRKRSRRRVVA